MSARCDVELHRGKILARHTSKVSERGGQTRRWMIVDLQNCRLVPSPIYRLGSPLSLRLFTYVIHILFEYLTYPDAYCANRLLSIILPLTKLYTEILGNQDHGSVPVDVKGLFHYLLKALERHSENEGLNTNLVSLIGHTYELWHQTYHQQLDLVLHQAIPQLNIELLNTYKARLSTNPGKRQQQQITERERRDTIKGLLNPRLASPVPVAKKDEHVATNPFHSTTTHSTF